MRNITIFFLHFQKYLEIRSRSFVWFLLSLVTPLLMILFWRGATSGGKVIGNGWTFSYLTTYYFLVVVGNAFLMSHREEDVGVLDIQEGNLSAYLLKPFSYYLIQLFDELPYRFMQGIYGVIALIFCFIFMGRSLTFVQDPEGILLCSIIAITAYLLSLTFKIVIGFLAFWLTEIKGLFEVIEVILTVFAGYLLPIALLPDWLAHFASFLPFPYMLYYPIIAVEGKLPTITLLWVLLMQIIWLSIFGLLCKMLWKYGVRRYSGVGQ